MRVQTAGNGGVGAGKLIGWVDWAGRHPGIVLLGALVTVILSSRMAPRGRGWMTICPTTRFPC